MLFVPFGLLRFLGLPYLVKCRVDDKEGDS